MLPSELLTALRAVRSVGVITGAGISAESGIPTYRGVGGVYDDPEAGDRMVEALTAEVIAVDPDRTWRAVAALARRVGQAEPNAAHHALVRLEARVEQFVLLTQNVDGLHQAAGSRNVIAIHGNAHHTVCTGCQARGTVERLAEIEAAPRCPRCGKIVRPDVVLFGELLPPREVMRMRLLLEQDSPDLVLAVGTTALFPYIAEPVVRAARRGRLTVEVNPEATLLSPLVDYSLRGRAGEILPALVAAFG